MANPSRPRRRARTILLLGSLAATLIAVLGLASPDSAHAVLVTSTPIDGAQVQQEPTAVRLTFDESVGLIPSAEQVISTNTGNRADTGTGHLSPDGTTIILPLKPDLPTGSYTAIWRVVSADTQIVDGPITFGLRANPSAPPAAPAQHTRGLDIADDTAQGCTPASCCLSASAPRPGHCGHGRAPGPESGARHGLPGHPGDHR